MKKPNDRIMLRLMQAAKPIAWWLLLGAVLDILAVISSVATPELLGDLIQILYDYFDYGAVGSIRSKILRGLALLLLAYGANSLFSYLNMRLMNQVVSRFFTCNLRIKISEKINACCTGYLNSSWWYDITRCCSCSWYGYMLCIWLW